LEEVLSMGSRTNEKAKVPRVSSSLFMAKASKLALRHQRGPAAGCRVLIGSNTKAGERLRVVDGGKTEREDVGEEKAKYHLT
jgi:hypothetical protein